MKFTPRSENDIAQDGLLEKGEYGFEVAEAVETTSKSTGNPMIQLKVLVYPEDPDANPRPITDYLLEKMAFKLRHFCEATGLLHKYEAGTLTEQDCIGKAGVCKIAVEQDRANQYPPKNKIVDYVVKKLETAPATASKANDLEDEDFPF